MKTPENFEVIIIGGSYTGLSAAMSLGRSLRNVLVIDSGKPCNRQTPHSHNFITHDGNTPKAIAFAAKEEVLKYPTVSFINDTATAAKKINNAFVIETEAGQKYNAKKLLFATGLYDEMPVTKGFAECWGISVLHCPYCHGYEVSNKKLGIIANGGAAFEFVKLIFNWSKNITLFTNGAATLTQEQRHTITQLPIEIIEEEIAVINHQDGYITSLLTANNNTYQLQALFARIAFKQHCNLPENLGCAITENGFLQIDDFCRTSVEGVYAAGDNTSMFRAVSIAVAAGTKAGAIINKHLIDEDYE